MHGARQADCPNCGAPIEWRLASSQAAVCSYCRFSVVRSDRELSALGRVADLVPTAAPIAVGDEGAVAGKSFRVLGRTQLDHGRGPWDEWYVGFADETWGWLARAEGRWYLTFARELENAPTWDALSPGSTAVLSGTGSVRWVATERGGSALLSAEGELPYKLEPQASGRYVDLEGEGSAFATLDYGDGARPVLLFAGRELSASELSLKAVAVGPRPLEKVKVARLSCPSCGAPVPIFVPSESERCGCQACGALLDHSAGNLQLLVQLEPPSVRPLIELGAQGELLGQARTVIGFLQKTLTVEGDLYTFREYLLHSAAGYSWLLEENHHWLHVVPVATSAVRTAHGRAIFEDREYREFARAKPTVDVVVGEFYWRVQAGDSSETSDYIAPPRLLSVERTANEISWSEGEYVTPAQLERAFALRRPLPAPTGVAAAQPNPHSKRGASLVFALLAVLWFVITLAYDWRGHDVLVDMALELPAAGATPNTMTVFSPPFEVRRGPTTLQVSVDSPVDNGWVQVESALLPEQAGQPRELNLVVEHYTGVSDGESWSEGGRDSSGTYGRVQSGRYSMRFVSSWEPQQNGWSQNTSPRPRVKVTRGERGSFCCCGSLFLLALPWLLSRSRRTLFELRRKENENL